MSNLQQSEPGDISRLPPEQRAQRYRRLADMHLRFAEQVHDAGMQAAHLELASLWTRLAAAAEHGNMAVAPDFGATTADA